ncbi:phenylalanyl-tRNA synthetase, alpha subunit family protein [Trichomonas vaginalis G3]|uniref:phenylalanine--tRNA ligase n=1 Tax=Trichomonas vaginalis (strain ATCC PRA-98 / G3) TaxID=412133 RepID=A2DJE6_TRIV3|nr:phenylalanyl-tRNA synthetase family [Trichomonas vaginalis G3]EAY19533.1 phenylalanyl-tRNA synthetase, alpha subunit family protein [Trichomonas vaginalis G3]KAI5519985.1 phenylalanyl-tRNA synthetase family [Trichomonas vaginalis G3]|eukprot:XP_001580519.1 phenylalanyl-tRNA synthetase, alpha subunit family protein [Trichomonas vaginalis G3]
MSENNAVLAALAKQDGLNSLELAQQLGIAHDKLYAIILSLQALNLITFENKTEQKNEATAEGKFYAQNGTPEFKFAKFVSENPGKNAKELTAEFTAALEKIYPAPLPVKAQSMAAPCFGKAKQAGYIKVDGGNVVPADISKDKVQELLADFEAGKQINNKDVTDLTKRGLIAKVNVNYFILHKGDKFVDSMDKVKKAVAELTEDMVKSGEWQNVDFAPLNFEAQGTKIPCGHEHPLLKVRAEFRNIFFQMGFEEMDTSKWVENSFWNFDSLFQGQQHPCRDMHDTFFLSNPEFAQPIPDHDYFLRVKDMHVNGGNGSIGLRYDFSEQIPLTNIMRTHTTAVSSRTLKMLADEFKATGELRPRKFFSIDRVYRNETLDATHLAEFHQVEGFIIDKNLSLGDLMRNIREFFSRIGLNDISFKPAYNPYTEPSMEIFAYHPGLGREIEIGNSGMFRPEMLESMGIPKEYTVIAWGFGLERPTMIEYKIDEIRKLEGPNVSLDLIENVPMCRLTF